MFHQSKVSIDPKLKSEILEAIGENTKEFYEKISWLRNKWALVAEKGIGDCHEVRTISPVIVGKLTPTNAAIITDNVEFFKKHYNQPSEIDERLLERACLCGAQKITDFLLKKCGQDPLDNYSFILTYVSASPNELWAKEIAKEMQKKNMKIPAGVYLFCSEAQTLESITEIFKRSSYNI